MKRNNIRKKTATYKTEFHRSIRAISPVIATLLMIAIAVVASLVVYAFATGYIGDTTSKTGKAIQLQSFAVDDSSNLHVYVQNVGQGNVELSQQGSVYVNSELVPITMPSQPKIPISEGETVDITVPLPSGYSDGDRLEIKVTTTDGTFMITTGTSTQSSSIPTPTPDPGLATPTVAIPTLAPVSPITLGESVTGTVTVSGSAGTPTGTVTFWVSTDSGANWATIGSVKTLISGSATSDTYTPAAEGSGYLFHADYSGDSNYNPATGNDVSLTVNPAATPTPTPPPTPVTITQSPTADSDYSWDSENNAYANGGGYGTSNNNNEWVIFTDYGFTVPSGATVTQVRVRLDAWRSSYGNDDIRLEVNDGSWHTYSPNPISLSGSETTIWCDVTSLSSGGWTPSEVNSIQVRVTHVQDGYGSDNIYLDWIPIEVTYIP